WRPLVAEQLALGSGVAMEFELRRADGEVIPVEVLMRNRGGDDRLRVAAVRDLREQKQALDRIHHLAHHDALTGLPNRKLFLDSLNHAIASAIRTDATVAVLCLDLDRFKNVNDLLGHWGGD